MKTNYEQAIEQVKDGVIFCCDICMKFLKADHEKKIFYCEEHGILEPKKEEKK